MKKNREVKHPRREQGFQFGQWTVLMYATHNKDYFYYCRCEGCGLHKVVGLSNLELGKSTSCVKCANKRILLEKGSVYLKFSATPRDTVDRLANRYYAILSRCRGVGYAGHRYGGRGISCTFVDVYDFVGYCLLLSGHDDRKLQVDRIDNDGNYQKGNLHFVSSKVNNRNKDCLRFIKYEGRKMSATEFWEIYCPEYRDSGTVARKIREGKTANEIIIEQCQCRGPNKKTLDTRPVI